MNILGPVPHFLPWRPVETRVLAISLPSRLGFSSPRSVSDCLFPSALVVAALLVGPAVGQPFEVGKVITGFGQFESALDSVARSSVHRGEGGKGVDLFIGVDHLVVGSAESVKIGSDSPVLQVSGLVLDDGKSGGWASDEFKQPVREWDNRLFRVVDSSVHVDNGRGGTADISIGETGDPEVVHLFDPFGRSVNAFCGKDLEVRVVAVILDIARRGSGESVLIVLDLLL